jgi:hypothetical protein
MLVRTLKVVWLNRKFRGSQTTPYSYFEAQRERGDDRGVARALRDLSDENGRMGLLEEGIQQAKEALEILNGSVTRCTGNVFDLTRSVVLVEMLREEPYSARSISFRRKASNFWSAISSSSRRGYIKPRARWRKRFAILRWPSELRLLSAGTINCLDHFSLGGLFLNRRRFDDGHAHVQRAMSYTVNNAYLGVAMVLRVELWCGTAQTRRGEVRGSARRRCF